MYDLFYIDDISRLRQFTSQTADMEVGGHRLTGSSQCHIVGIVGIGIDLQLRMYEGHEQRELSTACMDDEASMVPFVDFPFAS